MADERNTASENAQQGTLAFDPPTRRCTGCGETKPLAEFTRESKGPGGRNRRCRACFNEYFRAYRAAHRSRINEIGAAYHERAKVQNPEMLLRRFRRRRERVLAAGTVSRAEKQAIWDAHDGRCYICHGDAEQYDHVQPLAKGGKTTVDNIRPVCAGCNARKADDWPIDFDELRARIYREYRREHETLEASEGSGDPDQAFSDPRPTDGARDGAEKVS